MSDALALGSGPFRARQLRSKDRYELDDGHAIHCAPTGGDGARGVVIGGSVLASDPYVEEAGFDAGYSPDPKNLRAPDIAVGNVPDAPGWIPGAPPLAVEYAGSGQNEAQLRRKIKALLAEGTRQVWVVRLLGERRVEVHERGSAVRTARVGEALVLPGVLKNPVPVEALFDADAARGVTFRNLLEREGYSSLEDVRGEGREEGREEGRDQGLADAILLVLEGRGLLVGEDERATIRGCRDREILTGWVRRAATIATVGDLFTTEP